MSRRSRIIAYGSAGLLIVAGAVCGAAISGVTGEVLAFVLDGLGLIGLCGLVFLEIGLSEDRERDRERRARERAEQQTRAPSPAPRHKLRRTRGERRRLR
jgi:hypothetical protein